MCSSDLLGCKIYATPFTAVLIKEKFKEKHIDITKDLQIVELNGNISLEKFEIEYITLTHSILEPNGLKIETPAGTIFHTGDWKVDPNPLVGSKVNEEKLKKIGDEGMDCIVNLSVLRTDRKLAFDVSTKGNYSMMEAARINNIKRVINTGPHFQLVGQSYKNVRSL